MDQNTPAPEVLTAEQRQRILALRAARDIVGARTMFSQSAGEPAPLITLAEYILTGTTPWQGSMRVFVGGGGGTIATSHGGGGGSSGFSGQVPKQAYLDDVNVEADAMKAAAAEFEEDAEKRAAEATASMTVPGPDLKTFNDEEEDEDEDESDEWT